MVPGVPGDHGGVNPNKTWHSDEEVLNTLAGDLARAVLNEGVEKMPVVGNLSTTSGVDHREGSTGATSRWRPAYQRWPAAPLAHR